MRRFAMLILVVVAGAFTPDDASSQQCKICDQEWITGYGYIHDFLEWQENSTNCEDAVEGHPVAVTMKSVPIPGHAAVIPSAHRRKSFWQRRSCSRMAIPLPRMSRDPAIIRFSSRTTTV